MPEPLIPSILASTQVPARHREDGNLGWPWIPDSGLIRTPNMLAPP